jgi:hypothetical protein
VKLYCVIGMHRSGTSVVSRILNLLGAHLGPFDDLMPPGSDNPTGFWESRSVVALHDDLLGQLGGRWDNPAFRDDGWERDPALEPFRKRAREVVATHFADAAVSVWKDPRGSLLLPFWRTVCDVAGSVLVVRRPSDVAASLHRRDGISPEQTALLWLRYVSSAWRSDRKHLLVSYEGMTERLDETCTRLAEFLELSRPNDEVRSDIRSFVKPRVSDGAGSDTGPLMHLATAIHTVVVEDRRPVTAPIVDLLHDRWKCASALADVAHLADGVFRQLIPKST